MNDAIAAKYLSIKSALQYYLARQPELQGCFSRTCDRVGPKLPAKYFTLIGGLFHQKPVIHTSGKLICPNHLSLLPLKGF